MAVDRELATADLHDAEAKDRSLDRLRPIFATGIDDDALRVELVDRVAAAFAATPANVARWARPFAG